MTGLFNAPLAHRSGDFLIIPVFVFLLFIIQEISTLRFTWNYSLWGFYLSNKVKWNNIMGMFSSIQVSKYSLSLQLTFCLSCEKIYKNFPGNSRYIKTSRWEFFVMKIVYHVDIHLSVMNFWFVFSYNSHNFI